ncbi:hypothetical protein ACFL6C_06745 [Myxococcota bacterium]
MFVRDIQEQQNDQALCWATESGETTPPSACTPADTNFALSLTASEWSELDLPGVVGLASQEPYVFQFSDGNEMVALLHNLALPLSVGESYYLDIHPNCASWCGDPIVVRDVQQGAAGDLIAAVWTREPASEVAEFSLSYKIENCSSSSAINLSLLARLTDTGPTVVLQPGEQASIGGFAVANGASQIEVGSSNIDIRGYVIRE